MEQSIKKQTMLVTGLNGCIRVMGFLLRILMARILGAEIMGITELASGVHMLAITPLTSGLPMAISRLTTKAAPQEQQRPLEEGLRLVLRFSLFFIPVFLLLSPWLAKRTGDIRTLPSLWFTAPCILILGYSGVFNGYCYGIGRSFWPAVSELTEQTLRIVQIVIFLPLLRQLTAPWLAAVPVASTMTAEIAGLALIVLMLRLPLKHDTKDAHLQKQILKLAYPSTLARLIHTLVRSVTAILIPLRLTASGLLPSEATAGLGKLNGMVLPLMTAPCIFTGALSLVMAPRLVKNEENTRSCKQMMLKLFTAGVFFALFCTLCMFALAPVFAVLVYRLPELTPIFRAASPLCFLCAIENLTGGTATTLGLQKQTMYGALPSSLIALFVTWLFTAEPALRLYGVIIGLAAGHILCLVWNSIVLRRWWRNHMVR